MCICMTDDDVMTCSSDWLKCSRDVQHHNWMSVMDQSPSVNVRHRLKVLQNDANSNDANSKLYSIYVIE